jgi:DNA-binding MarR family transcriptional regulator
MRIEQALECGLTIREFWVMHKLSELETTTLSNLSNQYMTPAGLTGMIDKLEGLGFTTRTRCEKDRRKIYLKLTNKGQNFFADY